MTDILSNQKEVALIGEQKSSSLRLIDPATFAPNAVIVIDAAGTFNIDVQIELDLVAGTNAQVATVGTVNSCVQTPQVKPNNAIGYRLGIMTTVDFTAHAATVDTIIAASNTDFAAGLALPLTPPGVNLSCPGGLVFDFYDSGDDILVLDIQASVASAVVHTVIIYIAVLGWLF